MPRYVAFLRGVSPMNAKMPELKRSFELAGFSDVRTLLSSGNVVFTARSSSASALQRRAEKAMQAQPGRSFGTFVRAARHLQEIIESDPYAEFSPAPHAKRIVTFLRTPVEHTMELPIEQAGASILKASATEVFSVYLPSADGPVFMRLLERTFGADITTRTLETVRKCAGA